MSDPSLRVSLIDSATPFHQVASALAPAYVLKSELGRGGMASVFLAHDRKHDRDVAVKVLSPELAASLARDRFLREIRVAARLAHPHILPLLDSGEAAGLPYYVMPFVEGDTLRGHLDRHGRFAIPAAIMIGAEVGDALEYAHAAGIIHRDVKPENIMMVGDHAVVMDFGIARAMHTAQTTQGDDTTHVGVAVGTPAYMSPEQATADPSVDARTDQYSLAVVLFELIAGSHPFGGRGAHETIVRRLTGPVPHLRDRVSDAPVVLDRTLTRAMALDAADRYPSVADFVADLRLAQVTREAAAAATRTETASLAVLPFVNLSRDEDSEYFSDGITEEIITALSRVRNLRVAARSSAFAFKGQQQDVRRVGSALGVRSVLEGSVRRAGTRVRVTAQLVEATSGFQLWSDRFDRELDDIFAIQEDIAHAIVAVLQVRLLGDETRPLAAQGTVNPVAHDLYLRARFNLNRRVESALGEAAAQLREAVTHDPSFVLAHAALGEAYLLLGLYGAETPREVLSRSREASEVALGLDPSLGEAHSTLGSLAALLDWDWVRAEQGFQRAITLSPRSPGVRHRYAMDCLLPQRRFADALQQIDEACLLDPLSLIMQASRGVVMSLSGDVTRAVDHLRRIVATDGQFAMGLYFLGGALRDAGRRGEAEQAFRDAMARGGGTPEMAAGLAQTLVLDGQRAEARAILTDLESRAATRFVSPALRAQVHLASGNTARALELLERAADERDPELLYLTTRSIYAPLAGDPRFERVRASVGLPSAAETSR